MKNLFSLAGRMKGVRRDFLLAVLCVWIESGFEVVIPLLMADIIDQGVLRHDSTVFLHKGLLMLVCAFFSLLFGLLYARCAAKGSSSVACQLRTQEYDAIQAYSFANIDHFEASSLITRLTSDVSVIQNALTSGIRPLARGPVMLVMGVGMCFAINARLSLVFFCVMPFLGGILVWIISKVAPRYALIQKEVDALNEVVQENLIAIRLVKAFVQESYKKEQFETINRELRDLNAKTFHYALLNLPSFQLTMYTAIVVLMILGVQMIQAGTLQVGQLTGVLSYVLQIINSFMMLSNVFLLLVRSMASVNRIEEVFQQVCEIEDPANGIRIDDGSIVFEDVTFQYSKDAQKPVLSHIDLHISSGSRVGILGATGSAKSSLVQLIPRLYDPTSGTIKVSGKDIRSLDLKGLREDIGMVLQNNVLFSGTVEENLRWGNPDATPAQIEEACRRAAVDELLEKLPGGLQMELGQGGVNVSGGQKQRLCIARALLKQPKILIFDDSTSAVDTATDKRIRSGLQEIKGLTQIIIAQRISSVEDCDMIVILDNGTIAAIGSHEELMASSPIYREIRDSQKRGDGQ